MATDRLHRRAFIKIAAAMGGVSALATTSIASRTYPRSEVKASEPSTPENFQPNEDLIKAPKDPGEWAAFRDALVKWRKETKERLNYDDSLYSRHDFAWVPSNYACCFAILCDQTFYDPTARRFVIESFLEHGVQQFGGYDSVVLWHAYPRIGVDDRNQFDFYRDMPGGLSGLRDLSCGFHARGVKVYIDYNPWDIGTRRERVSDIDALIGLVKAIEADGIFLDTLSKGVAELRSKLNAIGRGVVLESELALPLENIHDHHMSWAQEFADSYVPGILRNKWFERRHVQHGINRWDRDHTNELHTAWMNGSGMIIWENVFGSWAGWSSRDRTILRAMLPIQRRYTGIFSGEGWTPLVQTEVPDVYASLWQANGLRLWTLVNRSRKTVERALLKVPHVPGTQYFDLVLGREVRSPVQNGLALLSGTILPRGIGAFLSGTPSTIGNDFAEFLKAQEKLNMRADFSTDFPERRAILKPVAATKRYRKEEIPQRMVEISPTRFQMMVEFKIRESGFYDSQTDISLAWSSLHKSLFLERKADLKPYAIDLTPVTNTEFAKFAKATSHRPRHPENFLKHWNNGIPPADIEDHPVVYVDLDDARAYAKWAGKRLPTEEEWQYAAQGPEGLRYPWGNEMKPDACNAGERGGTTSVTAFPKGRSPFGCYDMCGNTWEWTESERSDGRTRFCIIRGGSYYQAKGSVWYMDGGPQPANFAAKFLLMWPGLDRSATIGFRCVADLI